MDLVQYSSFACAPKWCNKQIFWTVTGEPVDDKLRRELFNAADQQRDIFLHGHNREWLCFVKQAQIGTLQYVEQLQLDALDIKRIKVTAGLQHLFLRFSGQTEDDMSDNLDADGAKRRDSLFETGERITAADKTCG